MNRVPDCYRGVWARTLLETPKLRDTTTFVRWLQTSHWHADLRVPQTLLSLPPADPQNNAQDPHQLASQQGFCGVTEVVQTTEGEACTWHRRLDFQPPRPDVDAGLMVFETPEQVIETGLHAPYLEVWQRLPDSTGRFIALAGLNQAGGDSQERFLVAGRYAMRARPRRVAWPPDMPIGSTLAEVISQHPAQANVLLDFDISFGTLGTGQWRIEQSTLPALRGACVPVTVTRLDETHARIDADAGTGQWQILEWGWSEWNL